MTTEERFNAAVSVIRNLPKNGSFMPSNDLMLTFYAYFKQATEGWENRGLCPPFWDVVRRAKWDAWNKLGKMPKEEAMNKYVEQLNKIVETMALTDNVANFLTSVSTYSGNVEDIEMSIGPTLRKVRSQPGSPFVSHDTSPNREVASNPSSQSSPQHLSQPVDVDDDDEDFLDSVEENADVFDSSKYHKKKEASQNHHELMNGTVKPHKTKLQNGNNSQTAPLSQKDSVNEILQRAIESLRRDLSLANAKVKELEDRQVIMAKRSSCLSLWNMRRETAVFIVLWPFFVFFILNRLTRKKQ
ncbi:acyl-CoA-binding domain-containing protein 5A [Cimex lectularius]|uniref:ACB domain-containing protein n=1 Tax=Cimex lectularius TaxID=79782 RepID=A0A8I6R7H3_CIMLE|nr:acyl-CoA-binding domain-containing protein 5A [Cimex lectularius]